MDFQSKILTNNSTEKFQDLKKTTILQSCKDETDTIDIQEFLEHLTFGVIKDVQKYYLRNKDISFKVFRSSKLTGDEKLHLKYMLKESTKINVIKELNFNKKTSLTVSLNMKTSCFLKDHSPNYRKRNIALIFETEEERVVTPYFSIVGTAQYSKILPEDKVTTEIEQIIIGEINPKSNQIQKGMLMRVYLSFEKEIDKDKVRIVINDSRSECSVFSLIR